MSTEQPRPGGYSIDIETGLTELEAKFVSEFVTSGGKKAKSAIAAGYAEGGARTRAWELLRKPKIIEAIARFRRGLYQHEATAAVMVLRDMMMDETASATVRKDIAFGFIDRAGDKLPTELILTDKRTPEEINEKLALLLSSSDEKGETEPFKH
ncbi:MAG TPA: hypothetical protein ENH43_00285 [Phycisphaerales bacterium]|nr:terminase small subunit [bacterium BMS3Abin11]HDZ68845.1 hypothetical protein [Phycisphaerales bacterium]